MTNEIELLQLTIREYKRAHRILKMNEDLLLYLTSNVKHIFQYADKYNIPLKNRDRLHEMTERPQDMLDEIEAEALKSELGIFDDDLSTENQHGEDPPKTQQNLF